MRKNLVVAVVSLVFIFLSQNANSQSYKPGEAEALIDRQVNQFMKRWNLPGGSLAMIKDGKLVYLKAYGDAAVGLPVNTEHLFRIASLSKPITAIAIMKLVERGLLGLDDQVFGEKGILNDSSYQTIKDPRVKSITVKQLLQHTGGWNRATSSEGDPMFNVEQISRKMGIHADNVTIIQHMLSKKLDFDPGTRFSYSNFGYNILGRVIEKITQSTYEEFVQLAVLLPLDISDMSLACNLYENSKEKEVTYHINAGNCPAETTKQSPYGSFNIEAMDAHGGWLASSRDLAKILVASAGKGMKRSLLSEAAVNQMITPGEANKHYGLGWFINAAGNKWHTGSLIGASSMMLSTEYGIDAVILFNSNPLTGEYFKSLDKLMWQTMNHINGLPDGEELFIKPASRENKFVNNNPAEVIPDIQITLRPEF